MATGPQVVMHSELLIEMRPSAHATAVDAVVTTMYRLTAAVAMVCTTVFAPNHLYARDDGRFANSPLKEWFDHLASRNKLCCAFCRRCQSAGCRLGHAGWPLSCPHSGEWIVVPDDSVVTEPNRFGPAVVWPYHARDGTTRIRCFIPGAGT